MNKAHIHILYPYPTGKAPSQRFRIELFLPFLEKDFDVKIYPFWSEKTWKVLYKKGYHFKKFIGLIGGFARRKLYLLNAHKADFIYIHREATPVGPPFIEWMLAKLLMKKIIYDFDDAIWLANQSEANRGVVKNLKYHRKVGEICKWAYKVSVGNEFLAAYARQFNENVVVIPTVVDTVGMHNPLGFEKVEKSSLIIGWTGTHSTFHQLELIWPILDDLHTRFSFTFHIISDHFPEMLPSYVRKVYWKKESEIQDLLKFDIGIMPLKDNEWEKGKCGFKLIQYMALEIPSVASDVGVNTEILHSPELGFLIPSNDVHAWKQALIKLLTDADLRDQMGKAGRKRVMEAYSVEVKKDKVLALFS